MNPRETALSILGPLASPEVPLGLQVWMVSGDNERTAEHIASEAGLHLSRVVAGVKPAGKLAKVQELRH